MFGGQGFSMIRRTAVVILYFPLQTNTCSKSATKNLKIIEEIEMKTHSKNNHRMCSIRKVFLISKIHRKTPMPEV